MTSIQDTERRDPTRVQSVDRAVTILEFLARNGWSGVTEVGEALAVHKSTAFRLLATLVGRGLVEQHPESGQYHLGFTLVHLARAVVVGPDIAGRVRPNCEWLAEETSETVTLSVLEGDECVTIDQIIAASSVVSRSWLGRRTPLHCTSSGKVVLAHLPEGRQDDILSRRLERFTDNTITRPIQLREVLAQVRDEGHSVAVEEFEEGLTSVAAPVYAADGTHIATIAVSGPSYRLTPETLADVIPRVRTAAEGASAQFGHSDAVPRR